MANSPTICQEAVATALKPYLDKGQKKRRRRQRKHHIQKDNKISQAMCPPQAPLSSILLAVFVILHANSASAQTLNTYHWRFYARRTYNGHNKVIMIHSKEDEPGLRSLYTPIPSLLCPALFSALLTETQVNVSRRSPHIKLQILELQNDGIHQPWQHHAHQP